MTNCTRIRATLLLLLCNGFALDGKNLPDTRWISSFEFAPVNDTETKSESRNRAENNLKTVDFRTAGFAEVDRSDSDPYDSDVIFEDYRLLRGSRTGTVRLARAVQLKDVALGSFGRVSTVRIDSGRPSGVSDRPDSEKDFSRGLNKKMSEAVMPLLIAYKMKFAALIPILVGGLSLLVSSTTLAGFFFALFAAVLGLKAH